MTCRIALILLFAAASSFGVPRSVDAGYLVFYARSVGDPSNYVLVGDGLTAGQAVDAPGSSFNGLAATNGDDDADVGRIQVGTAFGPTGWEFDAGLVASSESFSDPDPVAEGVGLSFKVTRVGDGSGGIEIFASRGFQASGTAIGSRFSGAGSVSATATASDLDFLGGMSLAGNAFDTASASIAANPTLSPPSELFDLGETTNPSPNANVNGPLSVTVGGTFTLSGGAAGTGDDQFLSADLFFDATGAQEVVPEPASVVLMLAALAAGGGVRSWGCTRRRKKGLAQAVEAG